jgi:hypothetical protein
VRLFAFLADPGTVGTLLPQFFACFWLAHWMATVSCVPFIGTFRRDAQLEKISSKGSPLLAATRVKPQIDLSIAGNLRLPPEHTTESRHTAK